MAEATQQPPVTLIAQVVKAYALLFAVEVDDGSNIMAVLALIPA